MRKLAILSTALIGLSFAAPAFAQNQSAPQPGLPPGAAVGAPMAQPPSSTGVVKTTPVGPQPMSPVAAPMASPMPRATVIRRRRVYHRRVYHRHVYHRAAPAVAPAQ